jgi:outer membrane protein assembly factor BamD (BamD/ComL family)
MATLRVGTRAGLLLLAACLAGGTGCFSWRNLLGKEDEDTPETVVDPPTESFVLRTEGFVEEKLPAVTGAVRAKLDTARELFRQEEYAKAESLFEEIASGKKNPPAAVQEALFYRAECLRMQMNYPTAADVYSDLLQKFPHTPYHDQAVQRMFDIANYWLNDTRAEMREDLEQKQGKRWFVAPRFVSFEKSKPLLDREGRAIELLEKVRMHDIQGPLADHALFLCGSVKVYRENYRDADHYFSQITARHHESPLAPKALELAIFCKQMSTGGADYDGRKVAEARQLVQTALTNYPQLAREKHEFLDRQLKTIELQQAEKEFKAAQFYERTGHPASAFWCYAVLRQRYPTTKYAQEAGVRMNDLRAKAEKEHGGKLPPIPNSQQAALPAPGSVGRSWPNPAAPPPAKPQQPGPLPPGVMQPGALPLDAVKPGGPPSPSLSPGSPPLPPEAGIEPAPVDPTKPR